MYGYKNKQPTTVVQFLTTSLIVRTTKYIKNLHCIGNKLFDAYAYDINSIQENTNIIDSGKNWNILLLKEALYIKLKKPILNSGSKASKELQLFN